MIAICGCGQEHRLPDIPVLMPKDYKCAYCGDPFDGKQFAGKIVTPQPAAQETNEPFTGDTATGVTPALNTTPAPEADQTAAEGGGDN